MTVKIEASSEAKSKRSQRSTLQNHFLSKNHFSIHALPPGETQPQMKNAKATLKALRSAFPIRRFAGHETIKLKLQRVNGDFERDQNRKHDIRCAASFGKGSEIEYCHIFLVRAGNVSDSDSSIGGAYTSNCTGVERSNLHLT